MSCDFQLDLAWSQVSVFNADLADPFNDWTEGHLAQGFSWRPGSVSFKLPIRIGRIDVSVERVDAVQVLPEARWAIVVPFATWSGMVEVSSIEQAEVLELPAGQFAMLYQTGTSRDGRTWVRFEFQEVPVGLPVEAKILRGDSEVNANAGLLMDAEPAIESAA